MYLKGRGFEGIEVWMDWVRDWRGGIGNKRGFWMGGLRFSYFFI